MTKILVVALFASTMFGGTLTTASPNNGSGGVFMDLTASSATLLVTSFDTYFGSAPGSAVLVEVYTRLGSYVGFDSSNAGWTLSGTANATSAGSTSLAAVILPSAIQINAGQTLAVYLASITPGGGIRYTGTSATPPQTTWSNADLTLFGDTARTGAVAFAGTLFSPRNFCRQC